LTVKENGLVIELDQVSFSYEDEDIFEGISLGVARGESMGFLGENGSGKTTLLRLMAGLLRPREGKIMLLGRDLNSYRRKEVAREVSIVAQGTEPVFDFTVEEVVLMGRNPYIPLFGGESREDIEKTEEAMRKMGVIDLRGKVVTQLSAGELQRVIIARSLAQETRILLLDEPTTGLDVRHRIELVRLLKRMREEREMTIVTVSHDIDMIAHFVDRVILMGRGVFLADGPTREVVSPEKLYETYGVRMIVDDDERGLTVRMPWDDGCSGGDR